METARQVLSRLKQIKFDVLFDSNDPFYSYKLESLHQAMAEIHLPGDFAEFGVYTGRCARFLSNYLVGPRKLHLFDSFEGLPEDWVGDWKAGAFKLSPDKIPKFEHP